MQRVDRDTSADTLYTARSAKKRNCCHMRTSWYPVVTRGSTEEAIPGDETRGVVERVREHALIVGAEETVTAALSLLALAIDTVGRCSTQGYTRVYFDCY